MSTALNHVVEQYSLLADKYDDDRNLTSCWGKISEMTLNEIRLRDEYRSVVDVGCGTGRALEKLASRNNPLVSFIGVEPAPNMRARAAALTKGLANVRIMDGSFENIPLESGSVDYMYSIMAFHWTTDLVRSVNEMRRVLKPGGEFDLFFIGRDNGREFISKTTPIFLKFMGAALLLESASMRKQLSRDHAAQLFSETFPVADVQESFHTYHDSLENHWSWWVRIEGHFVKMPPGRKAECDLEVKKALAALESDQGIPYTIHLLHARLGRGR